MTDIRMIVSWGRGADLTKDWLSNTLYFAHQDPGEPNYSSLANDLRDIYAAQSWTAGSKIEVRAYNMDDPKPRPERAYSQVTRTGSYPNGPAQVALCLSYYSERNLPRQRGRVYLGPWNGPGERPTTTVMDNLILFGRALAGLGGLNVDWSVYSPTKAAAGQDPTMSISNIWVDDSYDIVRSRKLAGTSRVSYAVNE